MDRRGGLSMDRLDDTHLNIRPEVAAILGYPARRRNAARPRRSARDAAQPPPIFITLIAIACAVCLGAAGTAHHQAAAEPSQPQVSEQSVPVGAKQQQQSDAIPVGTAQPAAGASDPAAQVPVHRDDARPAREIHYPVQVQVHETAQNPGVEVNPGNEIPDYLPADYATGRVTEPLLLIREMPRGGAVDPLGYVPPGTCLLYERLNANGWRRVASLYGRYAGYAQVYPTVAYQPQPMRPELLEAIAMIRRIP